MAEALEAAYLARAGVLEEVAKRLHQEASDALASFPHLDRLVFRVKDIESFLAKAGDPNNDPPYETPLREIEDQVAGRVIVYFLEDIREARERLARVFRTVEQKPRRPEHDAQFGYESEHLICVIPPQARPDGWNEIEDSPVTFEIQIRTIFMHAYAQPQHGLAYKAGRDLGRDINRRLAWIAASSWGADQFYQELLAKMNDGENADAPKL